MQKILVLFFLSLGINSYCADVNLNINKSKISFSIVKFKIGKPVQGNFTKFSGSADYDPVAKTIKNVKAIIDAASVDTKQEKRDNHLRSEDFFYVEKYPQLKFISKNLIKLKDKFTIVGDLTMRGVTNVVTLNAQLISANENELHFKATGFTDRLKYNISWNKALEQSKWTTVFGELGKAVLADKVNLELDLYSTK